MQPITPFDTDPHKGKDPLKSKSNVKLDAHPGERPAIPDPAIESGFFGIEGFLGRPNDGPKGSDVHPLVATYQVPEFSHEIGTRPIEAITGERVEFVRKHEHDRVFVGAVWSLERRPEGSKAELDGHRIVFDVPGCYLVACTLGGGWRRLIVIAAFDRSTLDAVGYLPAQVIERRLRLRAIVRDANVTPETIVAGLERGETDLATLAGYSGKKRGAFRLENYR